MEFTLLQDRAKRKNIFLGIIVATAFFILLSMNLFGVIGLMGWIAFFISLLITPFLINRYKFFIYMWFFAYPIGMVAYHYLGFNFGGKNPIIFLLLALSGPFALILFYRDVFKVLKDIPAFKYWVFFFFLLILNLLRPGINNLIILNELKFFGFGLFMIMCSYSFYKKHDWKKVATIYAVWVLINCLAAIFQKVTGIGIMYIDGFQRTPGLLTHPNGLSGAIVIYLSIFTYLMNTIEDKKARSFYIVIAAFCLIGLLLTLTKYAILCFGIISIFAFTDLDRVNKMKTLIYLPVALVIFAIGDYLLHFNLISNLFNRFFNDSCSFNWRLKMWGDSISLFDFKTLMLGAGPFAFGRELVLMGNDIPNMHNGFLTLASNFGILGLSYMAFYAHFLFYALKELKNQSGKTIKILLKLLFLLAFIILIKVGVDQALFDEYFTYPMVFFITVVFLEIKKQKSQYE